MNKNKKTSKSATHNSTKSVQQSHYFKGGLFILFGFLIIAVLGTFAMNKAIEQQRLNRINAIYQSFDLSFDDGYMVAYQNVFGDKRVYEWDKGRTYSSAIEYYYGADVDETAAELRQKIEAAGFEYFDEPYPGSADIQWHFKSDKGEYVRLTVSSKLRDDAITNAYLMNQDDSTAVEMDANAGPSSITLKVNLDDNNE